MGGAGLAPRRDGPTGRPHCCAALKPPKGEGEVDAVLSWPA